MSTKTHEISNSDDLIDSRDVIARIEYLESECEEDNGTEEDRDELKILLAFMEDMKGYGGDEQWRGDWYPVTIIRDSYFKEYAQELAEDIGAINAGATWPNNCIDWEQAARELRMDYTCVDFDGVDYWVR